MDKQQIISKILREIDRENNFVLIEGKIIEDLKFAVEKKDIKKLKRYERKASRKAKRIHRFLQVLKENLDKIRELEPASIKKIIQIEQQLNIYEKNIIKEVSDPMLGKKGIIPNLIRQKPINWNQLNIEVENAYKNGIQQLIILLNNLENKFKDLEKEQSFTSIKEADEKLTKIMAIYNLHDPVDFINPINGSEEKEKFFDAFKKGIKYNPQFIYKRPEFAEEDVMRQTEEIMKKLRDINLDYSTGIGKLFEKKRHDLIIKLKLIRLLGTKKITKYSIKLYSKPSTALLKKAIKICLEYKASIQSKKPYDAKQFQEKINLLLIEQGFLGFKTKIDEKMSSKYSINSHKKIIKIKAFENFEENDLKRILFHELGVHFKRTDNARSGEHKILKYGSSGYLTTEEGLATYVEKKEGITDPTIMQNYALRVIAVYNALHKSFYDVFQELKKYSTSDNQAYNITQRAKEAFQIHPKKEDSSKIMSICLEEN